MRVKTLAPIVLFVVLTLTGDARAQQSGKSVPPSPAWNDNSLITVQKTGGDPTRAGDVKIEFYGHDAFKITSPVGVTVLTDPWRNRSEEHTSELQSLRHLVCRLLLEKKKKDLYKLIITRPSRKH